jgi:hypothetical protein
LTERRAGASLPAPAALGLLQGLPGTGMRAVGLPLSFDGARPVPRIAPPALDADAELLRGPVRSPAE